jgi:hypothetical protein
VPTAIGEDQGSRGVIGLAAGLAGEDWGFPLLHDITDCLRIGDVTFIKPDGDNRTLELKTQVTSTEEADGTEGMLCHQGDRDLILRYQPDHQSGRAAAVLRGRCSVLPAQLRLDGSN